MCRIHQRQCQHVGRCVTSLACVRHPLPLHHCNCCTLHCTAALAGGEQVQVDARVIKLGRDVATIEVQLRRSSNGQLVATVSSSVGRQWGRGTGGWLHTGRRDLLRLHVCVMLQCGGKSGVCRRPRRCVASHLRPAAAAAAGPVAQQLAARFK